MGSEDESCINCMQGFIPQSKGYLRKSLRTSFSWSLQGSHFTNTCPVMFIADALSTLLPDSDCNFQAYRTANATIKGEMKFICLSCLAMLKQAMVGRAAEKEFLLKRSGGNRCFKQSEVKVERESESNDDAPPVRLAPPALISSAPIRSPLGHKRRSETENESIDDDAPPVRLAPPDLVSWAPTRKPFVLKRRRVDPDPMYVMGQSLSPKTTIKRPRVNKKKNQKAITIDWRNTVKKAIDRGDYQRTFKTITNNSLRARGELGRLFYSYVKEEIKDIKKNCQMLVNPVTEENVQTFNWDKVAELLFKKMPHLFSVICTVCSQKSVDDIMESKSDESHRTRAAIGNVIATLLYLRQNHKYNFVAGLNSLLLWRSGCVNHKVIGCLHNLGFCLSVHGARNLVKRLTKLPSNNEKVNVDEDSNNKIPSEDDRSHNEDEQSDDRKSVEGNNADEQSYGHSSVEGNEANEQSNGHRSVEGNEEYEQSYGHSSVERNEDDEQPYGYTSVEGNEDEEELSDNKAKQLYDDISQDSTEVNNEQGDKVYPLCSQDGGKT